MELFLRIQTDKGTQHDVRTLIENEHTVGDLAGALGRASRRTTPPSLRLLSDGRILDPNTTIQKSGITSGDQIAFGDNSSHSSSFERNVQPGQSGVDLRITAGPHQGMSRFLAPGTYIVARSMSTELNSSAILLPDDVAVSREAHLTVRIDSAGAVTIVESQNVANESLLNGHKLPLGEFAFTPNDVIQVGDSQLQIAKPVKVSTRERDQMGQVSYFRTPFRPVRPKPAEFKPVSEVPKEPDPVKFAILTIVLPIVTGVMMAVILKQPRFLAFTALAPIMTIANSIERKRTGLKKYDESKETFGEAINQRQLDLAAAVENEEADRNTAAPDLAELGNRALNRTKDLWCRGRDVPEFLNLRVGKGDAKSLVEVAVDTDGEKQYIDKIRELARSSEQIRHVPISVPLAEIGVLGIHGALEDAATVTRALVVQAACLHSPEDLVIASLSSTTLGLNSWLKWLPHTRHTGSPLPGAHLADESPERARRLLQEILDVIEFRTAKGDHGVDRRWPWLLFVVDRMAEPDPAMMADILKNAPDAGISVIWVSDSEARIPPECKSILSLQNRREGASSVLWSTDPDVEPQVFVFDGVHRELPDTVSLSLAPLRDASSANATSSIPRLVPLYAPYGIDRATPEWIAQQWQIDKGYSLRSVLGISAQGPLSLDLVECGPHGLIGGTSGAGKSELIQSLIAGLVISHSPTELNLLFIDFKGGSSTEVFSNLPHVVGSVSDLNETLARRAKVSIRAELKRRARLFAQYGAKDLAEMQRRAKDSNVPAEQKVPAEKVPASLVIVVDEFATLRKELPEFVAEIIDIAQRGRSYGVHLILATQRPSSSIDDNISANANLRIGLRMLEAAESTAVLNAPDAAQIPVPLRGRALARLGPGQLVEFQSSFSGAPLHESKGLPPVLIGKFDGYDVAPLQLPKSADQGEAKTQLEDLIENMQQVPLAGPVPEKIWNPLLPAHLPNATVREEFTTLNDDALDPGLKVLIGKVDKPAERAQRPFTVDLEAGGGLVIFGTGASGKTSALRTIAVNAALDSEASGLPLGIFVLDFSSGELGNLSCLSHCAEIGSIDDMESTTRIIEFLSNEVLRRRNIDNKFGTTRPWPRALVLIDNLANMLEAIASAGNNSSDSGEWIHQLVRLIADGRQMGIHFVMTADRAGSVPNRILAGVTTRLVLRQVDDIEAKELGALSTATMQPGGGYLGQELVQVSTIAANETQPQDQALELVAATIRTGVPVELQTVKLSETGLVAHWPQKRSTPVGELGLADVTLQPVEFDLKKVDLLVMGPPSSGRSTALNIVGQQLLESGYPVFAAGQDDSPLRNTEWTDSGFSAKDIARMLSNMVDTKVAASKECFLIVDDIDVIMADDSQWQTACEALGPEQQSLKVIASLDAMPHLARTLSSNVSENRDNSCIPSLRPLEMSRKQLGLCA